MGVFYENKKGEQHLFAHCMMKSPHLCDDLFGSKPTFISVEHRPKTTYADFTDVRKQRVQTYFLIALPPS